MAESAQDWLRTYSDEHEQYMAAAYLAKELVEDSYKGLPIAINGVSARAKDPRSAAEKIARKGYSKPREQMTDLIGVRVLTTYAHGVDQAADRLTSLFRVKHRDDKRGLLTLHEFGYRSVHLVLHIDKARRLGADAELLETLPVEVQIRSVLEHAWAEIEHDLRYKGGSSLSNGLNRRFSAVAGALEVLDREFDRLHVELYSLVAKHAAYYEVGAMGDAETLDGPRLMGILANRRPMAERVGPGGTVMSLPAAARAVALLEQCGLTLDVDLLSHLEGAPLLTAIREYAFDKKVDPDKVSAMAVVDLLAGTMAVLNGLDLQYSTDPAVIAAVESAIGGA